MQKWRRGGGLMLNWNLSYDTTDRNRKALLVGVIPMYITRNFKRWVQF